MNEKGGPRGVRPVLVAGATGFVGRALVPALLAEGHRVRVIARDPAKAARLLPPEVEVHRADLLRGEGLDDALRGVGAAYYLVVSLGPEADGLGFAEADRLAAHRFVEACGRQGVGRILSVGGLGEVGPQLSKHLESRREVARILGGGDAALTLLRAAVILGAGGSSFEMIVQLVERLPVMLCPRWVETRSQPIARTDLVRYLTGCLGAPATEGRSFDVGGPDVLRYWEMLERVGEQLGRPPWVVTLPVLTPSLSAHWVGFITEVAAEVARPLVDGLMTEAVCRENALSEILPYPRTPFDVAVAAALAERRGDPHGPRAVRLGWFPRPWGGRPIRLGSAGPTSPRS